MDSLDGLVEQAVSQVKNAFAQHDLEILGCFALTIRDAYKVSQLPFDEFCTTFGVPVRTRYNKSPPILLDDIHHGIGVGLPSSFTRDLPQKFITDHGAYIIDLPAGETNYVHGLFVPLDA